MSRRLQHGFTLVELLVVIAIIGILVALLLPAVQAARESARRMQCVNSLKQLTLGLQNHASARGTLPIGAKNDSASFSGYLYGTNRQTWVVTLLPFIEQQTIYDRYDQRLPGVGNANWLNTNSMGPSSACAQIITDMLCPSDDGITQVQSGAYTLAIGNYLGVFGDIAHDNGLDSSVPIHATPANRRAAFGINQGVRMKDILDGTSKTMVLAEYLRAMAGQGTVDWRGEFYEDEGTTSQLFTQFTPNSSNPDVIATGHCVNRLDLNLPCVEGMNETAASRSRHPGGVNVGCADGSVQFVTDEVSLVAWQAYGTINGSEVVNAF